MNRIKSAMLLATLTALLLWIGQALGGQGQGKRIWITQLKLARDSLYPIPLVYAGL